MENASKALLIAGAILLAILIIAIGMFIYSSAQSNVESSITQMTTQEVQAFNSQFTSYEGMQAGANVKALIGRLLGNAKTYEDEAGKVPTVVFNNNGTSKSANNAEYNTAETDGNKTLDYVNNLNVLRQVIDLKHEYKVVMNTGTSGLINQITIFYTPE